MMNGKNDNYTNFALEQIKIIKALNAQYRKELKDAKAGTGMCSMLPENDREAIAKTLEKHISDNEKSIQEMLNSL